MRRHPLLLLVLVMGSGALGVAQQAPPAPSAGQVPAAAFSSESNFVEINAVVTDQHGTFVGDLRRDEIEIYEDGKLQHPSVFALVDVPVVSPAPAMAPELIAELGIIEPDVRTTRRAFDGRLYVILLDDLQTSVLRTQAVRDNAAHFVRQYVGDGDLAAVVLTSGRDDAEQEMTGSRTRLLEAIAKFQGQKLPAATAEKLAVHLQARRFEAPSDQNEPDGTATDAIEPARQTKDPDDPLRGYNAMRALRALGDVSTWMSHVQGRRKAVLFFSEGLDYDIYELFNRSYASGLVADARGVVAAAQRANVSIYAVDPRGLNEFGGESIDVRGLSDMPQIDFGTWRGFLRELLLAQESLISLAEETGGMALVRSNDIASGLARIALDNSRYYLLGYFTDPARAPGTFRRIEVKAKRSGLLVRARKGYMPIDAKAVEKQRLIDATSGTSATLRAALTNPIPVGNLPLRVFATPFRGKGKNASVLIAVEIDGSGLAFNQRAGVYTERIEVSIAAVDQYAKVRGGDRKTFGLTLQPSTYQRVQRNGVRFLTRLDLPPGRYQIRVGANESVGNATGTVPYDLEVPDYTRSDFLLGGIAITSSSANDMVTTEPDPQLDEVLPNPPVATRTFAPSETLTLFSEILAAGKKATTDVRLAVTVRRASDGQTVFTARDSRPPQASEKIVTHEFMVHLPLRGWPPGTYLLRVEATSGTGAPAARNILFDVS